MYDKDRFISQQNSICLYRKPLAVGSGGIVDTTHHLHGHNLQVRTSVRFRRTCW